MSYPTLVEIDGHFINPMHVSMVCKGSSDRRTAIFFVGEENPVNVNCHIDVVVKKLRGISGEPVTYDVWL